MTIKTYPLQFTSEKLEEVRKKAQKENKSIKQFIYDLIDKELKK